MALVREKCDAQWLYRLAEDLMGELEAFYGMPLEWHLGGSVALVLQGIPLSREFGDVDIIIPCENQKFMHWLGKHEVILHAKYLYGNYGAVNWYIEFRGAKFNLLIVDSNYDLDNKCQDKKKAEINKLANVAVDHNGYKVTSVDNILRIKYLYGRDKDKQDIKEALIAKFLKDMDVQNEYAWL